MTDGDNLELSTHNLRKRSVRLVLSDVSRMRCELLGAELMRNQPRFQVAGYAVTVADLVQRGNDADIAVISATLQEGPLSGFEALRELQRRGSGIRSLVLLDGSEPETVLAAFRGGARGVAYRSGSVGDLAGCIEQVADGQIGAGNRELDLILGELTKVAPLNVPGLDAELTRREQQLVDLLVAGVNSREIGRKLSMTERSVGDGLARIFSKLGVRTRVELALTLRRGSVAGEAHESIRADAPGNDSEAGLELGGVA